MHRSPRTQQIIVKLNERERSQVEQLAESQDTTVSDAVRRAIKDALSRAEPATVGATR